MIDDLISRLRAVESASPDFLGDDEGRCVTCYHRNPDGPEAAEALILLRDALEDWSNSYHCPATFFNEQLTRLIAKTDEILAATKIEKAE